jgi:hypothetical protein
MTDTAITTLALEVHQVGEQLPDADLDVIVFLEDGTSTLGALDAEGWVDCGGMSFAHMGGRVTAWAHFPEMP